MTMQGDRVYDSRAIAKYFLQKAAPQGLTPLQIIKLTYIAHGFMLGIHKRPLLEDDVEAWRYGPVLRRVYNCLPGGAARINDPIFDLDEEIEPDDAAILDQVFDNYGSRSGPYLSDLTHRIGSPWQKTWKTYGQNAVIPQSLIQYHYAKIMDEYAKAQARGAAYSPAAL